MEVEKTGMGANSAAVKAYEAAMAALSDVLGPKQAHKAMFAHLCPRLEDENGLDWIEAARVVPVIEGNAPEGLSVRRLNMEYEKGLAELEDLNKDRRAKGQEVYVRGEGWMPYAWQVPRISQDWW